VIAQPDQVDRTDEGRLRVDRPDGGLKRPPDDGRDPPGVDARPVRFGVQLVEHERPNVVGQQIQSIRSHRLPPKLGERPLGRDSLSSIGRRRQIAERVSGGF
jgi:hypothetical protein